MTDADIRRFEPNPATAELMEQILYEVKRVVVGQDRFLERVMVALLAGGHLLVEGVPGRLKTPPRPLVNRRSNHSFFGAPCA